MKLYTIIWEYCVGTFTNQFYTDNEIDAFTVWRTSQFQNELNLFSKSDLLILKNDDKFIEFKPVLLDGMNNVWCNDLSFLNSYLSLQIVLTSQSNDMQECNL